MIHEKVRRVARAGAIPIVLGGDHSITFPSAAAVARVHDPARVGIVHFDAHADTAMDQWGSLIGHGQPMRRLIDEGWVAGPNFVQVGLRGYWPDRETFEWMRGPGHALAHAGRDGGARRRGGDRRGDRAGARRPRPDLPLGRHRRRRPGDGARHRHARVRGDARPGAAACGPTDRGGRRPRRDGRRGGLTSRTTMRRSRRCSRST